MASCVQLVSGLLLDAGAFTWTSSEISLRTCCWMEAGILHCCATCTGHWGSTNLPYSEHCDPSTAKRYTLNFGRVQEINIRMT
eukprot:6475023-Amphidinium_carterae.1